MPVAIAPSTGFGVVCHATTRDGVADHVVRRTQYFAVINSAKQLKVFDLSTSSRRPRCRITRAYSPFWDTEARMGAKWGEMGAS